MFFLLHFLSVRLISLPFTSPWCWLGVSLVGLFLLLFLHWSLGLLIPFFAFPFVQRRPSPVIFSYFPKGLLTPTVLRSLPLRLVLFTGQLLGGLSFFNLDGQVIDLNWKIAHSVLYTAQRLSSFSSSVPLLCFCGAPLEILSHLPALWLKVFWRGFGRRCFLLTRCLLFCLSIIHCFAWILLSCARVLAFLSTV